MKGLENQSYAGRPKRMAQRNAAAIDIDLGAINRPEWRTQTQFIAGEFRAFKRFDRRKYLRRKGFVKFK